MMCDVKRKNKSRNGSNKPTYEHRPLQRTNITNAQAVEGMETADSLALICFVAQQHCSVVIPPKGGRGCLMSPPCLESQGCHLIPLCYLLSCSSAQSCYLPVLSFSGCWPFLLNFFPENSSILFVKRQAFLYGSCLAVRRSELVGGMCSRLPYDTGICCYAFIELFFFNCFCPFLFYTFFLNLV